MPALISKFLRPGRLGLAASLIAVSGMAWSQAPADAGAAAAAKGPPAVLAAPAEAKPDESNAQRGKGQPVVNAPVRGSETDVGSSNLPGAEKGVLIQPLVQYPGSRLTNAGEAWRQVRNLWILPYGGALIFISVLALALFYWRRGALGHEPALSDKPSGKVIERFTPFERAAHWTNASAFVVLAVSGLVMAFGKFLLLPIIGATLFGWLSYGLKTAHNFVGPLFAVSLVVVIITFIKDNFLTAADFAWLKRAGGMFGGHDVPSHRFNAGEKGLFWLAVLGAGLLVVGSGLVLDELVPGLGQTRGEMQIANMIHGSAAMLMMAVLIGHIYMGTIGTRGALGAMRSGYVSEGWAKEHHALWLADIQSGKIPAKRSPEASPTLGSATRQV